ncbi:hypothetical protein C4B68_19265 [Streptomyces dengpaensis]|uniref:Uncharacterized protein n=1 Tax=Streptomyces dengpaensis TaxID=2049881 RepID=A0ABM6SSY2_9ACTN|nr:hypothetical protein C4B68_19265 [Streptomyces dengpaensis]
MSATPYNGTRTRSCRSAAPANHKATPNQSPASSCTPAYPASANEQARSRIWKGLPRGRRGNFGTCGNWSRFITGLRTSSGPPTWC